MSQKLDIRPAAIMSTIVLLIALSVMLGWIAGIPSLVQPVGGPAMVFNTALCFALMALAVVLDNPDSSQKIRIQQWLGGSVIIIACAVLSQHLFNITVGLDWPSLHRWLADDNPYPGRMSRPTALSFLCCGAVLLLMHRARGLRQGLLVQVLTALPAAIAVAALIGLALSLRFVYPDYLLAQMAASTAACFIVLSITLWLCWRKTAWYRSRAILKDEGRRIGLTGALILAVVTSGAVLAGFGIAQREVEAKISEGLLQVLKNNISLIMLNVDQRNERATTIPSRPRAREYLLNLNSRNDDAESMRRLAELAESFLPSGFSGVAFLDVSGRDVLRTGQFADQPDWSLELKLPHETRLLWWNNSLVLSTRLPIISDGKVVGTVLAEQPLTALTKALGNIETLGQTSEIGICKVQDDMFHCIPQRFMPKVYRIPYSKALPMSRAVAGETGIIRTRDYRRQNVIAAHGPIGAPGFGMVVKMDTIELYAPIREYLHNALLLSLLLGVGGGVFLYARLRPLVGEIERSREAVREQGERALRVSEDRYSGIINSAMDAIIAIDERRCVLLFNPAAARMFQYDAAKVIGRPLDMLLPLRFRAAHEHHIREFAESGVTVRSMGRPGVISGLRANGEEFPIEASISQIGVSPGKLFTVILRDITERRQAEAAQRELSRQLIETEEAERRAISRELHDRIGQDLSAINLTIDIMRMQQSGNAQQGLQSRLDDMQRLVRSSIDSTRDIMADLHPAGLEDSGLALALQYHAEHISQRLHIPVTVNNGWHGARPAPAVELALFRIAQEAVSNIAKHAGATNIRIALEKDAAANWLALRISDDGRGFDSSAARPRNHGLRTMRERAQAVGAVLRVDSTPGKGTRISVELPPETT
ncbi:MAG: PAS domain-containing sensor histidine kinase [Betaproteobacteria bacterium]